MLITTDLLADFGELLRLHIADGDASENTIRSYYGNAAQYVRWCAEHSIDPAGATEADLISFRRWLTECYGRGTVAVKLAAVKQLYEAATWHGLARPGD
jgi:site-specific recombinase XerD